MDKNSQDLFISSCIPHSNLIFMGPSFGNALLNLALNWPYISVFAPLWSQSCKDQHVFGQAGPPYNTTTHTLQLQPGMPLLERDFIIMQTIHFRIFLMDIDLVKCSDELIFKKKHSCPCLLMKYLIPFLLFVYMKWFSLSRLCVKFNEGNTSAFSD